MEEYGIVTHSHKPVYKFIIVIVCYTLEAH